MSGLHLDVNDPASLPRFAGEISTHFRRPNFLVARANPMEVLELAPPLVRTEPMGRHQAPNPRGMPLDIYVGAVTNWLETGDYPCGEVLVERSHGERSAEREARYDAVFAAMNPA